MYGVKGLSREREEQMPSVPEATELLYVQGLTVQHGWREESRKWE